MKKPKIKDLKKEKKMVNREDLIFETNKLIYTFHMMKIKVM